MPVFLHGLEIANYRGIGPEPQRIAPFGDFNIFVGANNSGKSTILNFITNHIPMTDNKGFFQNLSDTDKFIGPSAGTTTVNIAFPKTILDPMRERIGSVNRRQIPTFKKLATTVVDDDLIWGGIEFDSGHSNSISFNVVGLDGDIENSLVEVEWRDLWQVLHGGGGGNLGTNWIPQTLQHITKEMHAPTTPTHLIPAKREIGPKGQARTDWGGPGLIDELAKHQNPPHSEQEKKDLFEKINTFLQVVTGKPKARIEIPSEREHILVHMDDKVLPLSSLGTGIHEVILIAAACTFQNNEIICIEEPETHLHPVLQRKLIQYLKDNTENQYFITTHSACFINMQGANVFRVDNDGQQTRVQNVTLNQQLRDLCADLGYKASDLVQANSVIWVEGPSDRIYLKHWVDAIDPDLIEGIHFSIMFYGGGLLNHLSAKPEDADGLIDLLAINKHVAIMIDSDKGSAHKRINATKKRVQDEVEKAGGFAWITKGREIENYVEVGTLQAALEKVQPKKFNLAGKDLQYKNILTLGSVKTAPSKVRVARAVTEQNADLTPYDLKEKIGGLVDFIRHANGTSGHAE